MKQVRTVAQKMGIKENSRAIFIDAPADSLATIKLPRLNISESLTGVFDYIHLFAKSSDELEKQFPQLRPHLSTKGMLWVSWPKAKQLGTDLTLPKVIETGYNFNLVESTCLKVDEIWSALKFTHPKEGRIYKNSYGKLPSQKE